MINISSFIAFHAKVRPHANAILYDGDIISYAALNAHIESTAGWLQVQGIRPGSVVAILMKNSPAFLNLAFATSYVGAVLLPINFRLSADEVEFICSNADAKLLLCDEELAQSAVVDCPVVIIDSEAQRLRKNLTADVAGQFVPRKPADLFRLIYTSGTTDRPKGVCHSYDNFYWKSIAHSIALDLSSATRLLVAGPLYHVGAFDLPGIAVLQHGGTLILHRNFDPAQVVDTIARERPDGAWLAPVMTGQVIEAAKHGSSDLSSLRWTVAGGERTPASRVLAFADCFPNARYIDAYGLTETCSGDTLMPAGFELSKIGSAGRTVAHVDVSIRDDDGNLVPAGADGEICIRGPKVFERYWNDPAKTAASFFQDWFRSGDVGVLDEEGFLFITDRKKDMIISGGENIAASEIERVLYEHPAVLEAAVIGALDPKWGERPVAYIVFTEGAAVDEIDLIAHCRAKLAGFKVPSQIVLRTSLPRNPSGKILKRLLREEAVTSE